MGKRKTTLLEPDESTRKLMKLNASEQVDYIRKSLGWQTYEKPGKLWLDTTKYGGSPRLNRVFGSEEFGIRYGKTITLAGPFSSGKTMLANFIAGMAQQDGAKVGYLDIENSSDSDWSRIHGLRFGKREGRGWTKVALFQPEVGIFGKTKRQASMAVRLQTAEELFTAGERWMLLQRTFNPNCKIAMIVDSTTAAIPEEEMLGGFTNQNMRTRVSPAVFLNQLTKRWNQIALNCNAIVIYIAQLRINPNQMYGNPERIPGGNGILFYPSIVNKVKRVKGGLIMDKRNENPVGLQSIITNYKNKVGGGSIEGLKCGFQAHFQESRWKFLSAAKLIKIAKAKKRANASEGSEEES
jgi:RecA/RadA recombinase